MAQALPADCEVHVVTVPIVGDLFTDPEGQGYDHIVFVASSAEEAIAERDRRNAEAKRSYYGVATLPPGYHLGALLFPDGWRDYL